MNFGLTQEQFQFILERVVFPLQKEQATIWCYGSRARGDYKTFSDLDLMVDCEKDLSRQIGKIQEDLENSNFPYKVDLVQLRHFAKSYLPSFEEDKVLFEKAKKN